MADDTPAEEFFDAAGEPIADFAERFIPKEEAEKVRSELEEAKKRIIGFEDKDLNFKNLRTKKLTELAEDERAKLTAREIEIMQRQEVVEEQTKKLSESQEQFLKQTKEEYRDDAISTLVGDDDETKKRVLYHYDRIRDEATSKEEIRKKVRDAVRLASDDAPGNPLFRGGPSFGSEAPRSKKKSYADTDDGKSLGKLLGLTLEEKK